MSLNLFVFMTVQLTKRMIGLKMKVTLRLFLTFYKNHLMSARHYWLINWVKKSNIST